MENRIKPLKHMRNRDAILVHEIYASIQGESTYAGVPCVFVRTTACHLRCTYCDTAHAFEHGTELSVDEIIEKVASYGIQTVELTGGEPLLQRPVFELMTSLCDLDYTVLLETSGTVSIQSVDRRVHAIVDVKSPGSGESHRNCLKNLEILWPECEVKFVIGDELDYEFAKRIITQYDLTSRNTVLFSPEAPKISPMQLAEWIMRDRLSVRFQVQLHKILWGDANGV